ncbi:hypothetical protein BYT27DRAFT_7196619 [Phlegmacium glaucopus]|nr:hypothetical protein BYT27DRAFT_7196619 [Phlegmacium glaucopus]
MPAMKGWKMAPISGRNPYQFGEIPGFPVGSTWNSRQELCNDGVHAGTSKGINGREAEGAFSVVISGGYEDDNDLGDIITYTGEGGREKRVPGVKWGDKQVKDQVWKMGNKAMQISHLNNRPIRVIRGSGLNSPYAPAKGYRYDGLYSVRTAQTVRGKTGFAVCQFKLVRRPNQPPLPAARPRPKQISPPVQVPLPVAGEGSSSNQPITIDSTPEISEDDCLSDNASEEISDFSDLEPF